MVKSLRNANIQNLLIATILSAVLVQFVPSAAHAGAKGGSDGGTNIDKVTKEPVEFEKAGVRVRINPRIYQGIYSDLLPLLRTLDKKIPGLQADLEVVLNERSWFITQQDFPARNENEEQPIYQDEDHVLLTESKIKDMSHEQLKKAWLHEMVRRLIQDGEPRFVQDVPADSNQPRNFPDLTQAEIDQLVEKFTVVFYAEYDMPALKLSKFINDAWGDVILRSNTPSFDGPWMGYLSRPEIDDLIQGFDLKVKYLKLCKAEGLTFPKNLNVFNSTQCAKDFFDVKTRDGADQYIKKCVKPSAYKNIVKTLNALQSQDVETVNHFKYAPFRTHPERHVWNDGFDNHAYAPMNRYGTINSVFGLGFFESATSAAIAGKMEKSSLIDFQELNDSERAVAALQGCAVITPEAVSAIMNADKPYAD